MGLDQLPRRIEVHGTRPGGMVWIAERYAEHANDDARSAAAALAQKVVANDLEY
jgi:hypothetical protein